MVEGRPGVDWDWIRPVRHREHSRRRENVLDAVLIRGNLTQGNRLCWWWSSDRELPQNEFHVSFVYIICVYYCAKQEGDIPQSQHNYFGLVTGDGHFLLFLENSGTTEEESALVQEET